MKETKDKPGSHRESEALKTLFTSAPHGLPERAPRELRSKMRRNGLRALLLLGFGAGVAWWLKVHDLPSHVAITPSRAVAAEVFQVPGPAVASASASAPAAAVVSASGYVVARRTATVSASVTGRIAQVLVKEGDRVNAGQPLARLDDAITQREVATSESSLHRAEAVLKENAVRLGKERHDLERIEGLAVRRLISSKEVDDARYAVDAVEAERRRLEFEVEVARQELLLKRRQMEELTVRAPFAGVVTARSAQVGEIVSPTSAGDGFTRTGICTIVDMASLEVEIDINEAYIDRVHAGQSAEVTLDAYPALRLPAKVKQLIPTANRQKATVQARLLFDRLDERILPDMGLKVQLFAGEASRPAERTPTPLLIPREAVHNHGDEAYVFVVRAERAEQRRVALGGVEGQQVEVLSGLAPGDLVVTSHGDGLQDGASVAINRGTSP